MAQKGFTLLEMVIAMVLLAAMLSMAWGGLSFALKAWDIGEEKGHRTADWRLTQNFLRRELSELFPMRFKDATTLKFAFDGQPRRLRFVSSRPAGLAAGGLSLVGLEVESAAGGEGRFIMRRAQPDDDAVDFAPLDKAEPTVLLKGVDSIEFSYFGGENDLTEPKWTGEWTFPGRIPQLVRMVVKDRDGQVQGDFIARTFLAEEAGCLENAFQRGCRPRRPNP
ncbi:prepilin-type N-terminal cleavage/methylation domain-containing protein [Usitatibacter palustris]|uniref:Type II secretion system protein J n=1 Tax=Usitatibacter palustris TaxID=2732487 RepID=A0A6M4HA91_9PROT|nr:prepilin-type N-terminal cleavage/methylation domain-containing protein [Usitatibacter palustris]QJR16476.1 hypothetical protein DSM104440_03311 [Usitatibacter palustris]